MRTAHPVRGAIIGAAAAALVAVPSLLTASVASAEDAGAVDAPAAVAQEPVETVAPVLSPAAAAEPVVGAASVGSAEDLAAAPDAPDAPDAPGAVEKPVAAAEAPAITAASPAVESPAPAGEAPTAVDAPAAAVDAPAAADTTAPTVWFVEKATEHGWHHSIDDFEIHARDDESGVKGIYTNVAGRFYEYSSVGILPDTLGDGKHVVRYWAADNAGNATTLHSNIVSLDRTAPEVHVESPAGSAEFTQGQDVLLEYGCADATSGILSCEGEVPDGSRLPTDEIGEHAVAIVASDLAGNITTLMYEYQVVADPSPVVVLGAPALPASGWYTDDVPLTLTATPTDGAAIRSIQWRLEGAAAGIGEAPRGATTAEILVHDEGETTVRYWATDTLGRISQPQSFTLKVDSSAPEITWWVEGAPSGDHEIEQGEKVTLKVECADALSGVAECENSAAGDYLPSEELGVYTVALMASDVAGNVTRSSVTYTVVPADDDPGSGGNGGNGNGGAGAGGTAGGGSGTSAGGSGGQQKPAAGQSGSLAETGADVAIPVLAGMLLATLGAIALLRRRSATR